MASKNETDLSVVCILDVDYFIEWQRLQIDDSFFLPTLATLRAVRRALSGIERELDITLHAQPRCEYGRIGVRVWRLY